MIGLRIAAVLVLLFGGIATLQTLRLKDARLELAAVRLTGEQKARQDSDAVALAHAEVRDLEHDQARRIAAIDTQHQQELADAQQSADRTIAALRDGSLKLRGRLAAASCPALSVPSLGAAAGIADQAPGLRPEDAGFLVQLADQCDADIRAGQQVIAEDRRVTLTRGH